MYLHVLKLTLLFYLCLLVQNAAAQECRVKNSINFNGNHFNFRLNGYVIQNITVPTVADCARECFRLTKCLSFNMATSIGLCQLNSVNSSTNSIPNLVADHKFNYFDLSVFPETIAGPCGKKPCFVHQLCLPTNGKQHTCANGECSPYIAPKNGKVKPATAVIVDRNVTVSCRAGFSIVGDSLLTCQFDGHWTGVAPKCKRAEPGWSIDPDTGWVANRALSTSWYLLATDAGCVRFSDAWKYCLKLGCHLLYLETDAEITMITDYLLNGTGNGNSFWLGMTDRDMEGDYMWWPTNRRVSTFNWVTGEPVVHTAINCAILDAVNSYQWRNVNGVICHYALCEKD